ncbi:MAG: TetR/AcrR family transcriptional regulator [Candidatus Alcyoniella australis]|nr:TetR/AcrR family transcriptional regulator [Candidatus Alcyoniella australis]
MSKAATSRKEREEQVQRAEFLVVAERLFATNGYHETKISDIAREAEYGVGTLYKLFENKQNLYQCLVEIKVDELHERIRYDVEQCSGVLQKIRTLIDSSLEVFDSHRQFLLIYLKEVLEANEPIKPVASEKMQGKIEEHKEFITQIFRDGVEQGLLRSHNAEDYTLALAGIVMKIIGSRVISGQPIDLQRDGDFIYEFFNHGALVDRACPAEG